MGAVGGIGVGDGVGLGVGLGGKVGEGLAVGGWVLVAGGVTACGWPLSGGIVGVAWVSRNCGRGSVHASKLTRTNRTDRMLSFRLPIAMSPHCSTVSIQTPATPDLATIGLL
jgi:hypothetical protein